MDSVKIISSLVIFLSCVHNSWCIKCMSCTYTFAGQHGTYDRECVTDVYNFSKTTVVNCDHFCLTKAVYVTGYSRLNSLYRGCGYQRKRFCDSPRSLVPSCELSCNDDQCNDGNGDLWQQMKPHPKPHPSPGGNTGSQQRPPCFLVLCLIAALCFIHNCISSTF